MSMILFQKITNVSKRSQVVLIWTYRVSHIVTIIKADQNWHKVKICLGQMFWQIYQKLMFIAFLSSGNLCLINHLKLLWPHPASMATVKFKEVSAQFLFNFSFESDLIWLNICWELQLINLTKCLVFLQCFYKVLLPKWKYLEKKK